MASLALSGDQARAYTASLPRCSAVRSIPAREKTLTSPSSPPVAKATPSASHARQMAAPWWACGGEGGSEGDSEGEGEDGAASAA